MHNIITRVEPVRSGAINRGVISSHNLGHPNIILFNNVVYIISRRYTLFNIRILYYAFYY